MRCDTPVVTMAMLVLMASPAFGDHNIPERAGSIKVDLVRAYEPCTVPNADHVSFTSACAPGTPFSSYNFGPAGRGKVSVKNGRKGIKLRFAVDDVRTGGGQPADSVEFRGRIHMRLTDDGCPAEHSCTVETFLSVGMACESGRCSASILHPWVLLASGPRGAAEITRIDVLDDAGNRFATAGILQ